MKKLKVTGGGLRTKTDSDSPSDEVSGHQSNDEDGSGHEAVMLGGDVRFNFHIGVNGPDEDTPKESKNLWSLYFDVGMHQEVIVKWFPFFPLVFMLCQCSLHIQMSTHLPLQQTLVQIVFNCFYQPLPSPT